MRRDEDELIGLAKHPEVLERATSNSLTIRERSTIAGILRLWPTVDRRGERVVWYGPERRGGRS